MYILVLTWMFHDENLHSQQRYQPRWQNARDKITHQPRHWLGSHYSSDLANPNAPDVTQLPLHSSPSYFEAARPVADCDTIGLLLEFYAILVSIKAFMGNQLASQN